MDECMYVGFQYTFVMHAMYIIWCDKSRKAQDEQTQNHNDDKIIFGSFLLK